MTEDLAESDPETGNRSPQGLFRSFCCALQGLRLGIRAERNLRIHLGVAALVCLAGGILQLTPTEWALISLAIGFVISAELFNAAIERTLDRIGTDFHELTRDAKDLAAAATLISALAAVGVGVTVLGPKLWSWLLA
ncbi:MAG: diacylglycerol kinase family protein [Planctomycetaceae bacterium]|nr:diacylglycerol kinase family protein [Planctomycetaceae bacterium]